MLLLSSEQNYESFGKPLPAGSGQPDPWQEPRGHALLTRDPISPRSLIPKLESARRAVVVIPAIGRQHQCHDDIMAIMTPVEM